jgi:hypothetical protein
MPLFGESYGLSELIALIAERQAIAFDLAESILLRKLRRGEVTAYCEWGYAVSPAGKMITHHRLSPEPWIIATYIRYEDDEIEVQSPQATDVRWATAIYFRSSEIDFLDEKHSREEIAREEPKQRKRPGGSPVVRDAIKARILATLRSGRYIGDHDHEAVTKEFGGGASRGTVVAALREALLEHAND